MSENIKLMQAIVIGGGLAGSNVAAKLAQNGREVLLLEKETETHDKVCGEFIGADAQYYLQEMGIDLEALGAARVDNIKLICGSKIASAPLPQSSFSLSRRLLDETLLTHAESSGAQIRRGHSVTNLTREQGIWRIDIAGHESIHAETVFLATGKHDLRTWHRPASNQNDFIGFKLHFKLKPAQQVALINQVEMTLYDGGYAGLALVEGGKANLCLVINKQYFAELGKNWDSLLALILKATPLLAERLHGAIPCWPRPLSIFGIPYGFVYRPQSDASTALYRLGDQMAVIPSFSGNGMSIALHTASLAVEHYLQSNAELYHRRAHTELLPLVKRASFLSGLAQYSFAQQCIMLVCSVRPKLITMIAAHNRIIKRQR